MTLPVSVDAGALEEVALDVASMGGRMRLRVACRQDERPRAERDLGALARRVERWVARLSRFEPASELCALNADPDATEASIGPTLAAVLRWALDAGRATRGVVDVGLLEARLAAEQGTAWDAPSVRPRWTVRHSATGRRGQVLREGRMRFDLDGVAKGWVADRALSHLGRYPAALVDADGDIAIATGGRLDWTIGVADPHRPGCDLVRIASTRVGPSSLGVATSGIDVHRWGGDPDRHHLIDPLTGRPAVTDVEQCTVVARSAALAEAVAKAVVIRGSEPGRELVARAGVMGAVLLLRDGEAVVTEGSLAWLA